MRGTNTAAPPIIGTSDSVREMNALLDALARHDCTVLIQGESGSGKELVARQIHARSRRGESPFVPVDCTTLTGPLFESQLFGHVRGAFTGAQSSTLGFFRAAEQGTLFLDEIGELDLPIQAKLLRCIQDHAVVPLGHTMPIRTNVRVIAATHRNLREMVARGQFREDLFYRLNVACLHVPPLRQRKDDIPTLAANAIDDFCRLYDRSNVRISLEAMERLCAYDWPGNVRELLNALEHALVFSQGPELRVKDLPASVRGEDACAARDQGITSLRELEREMIRRTLKITNGNQARAAQLLEVERHRLHRRIIHHGLQDLVRARSR